MTFETSNIIEFYDDIEGQKGLVVVRIVGSNVGLGVSLEQGGDAQVFLPVEACNQLIKVLQEAVIALNVNADVSRLPSE